MFASKILPLERCPYCSRSHPTMQLRWSHGDGYHRMPRADNGPEISWAVYSCQSCSGLVVIGGNKIEKINTHPSGFKTKEDGIDVKVIHPKIKKIDDSVPEDAGRFLRQAYETVHAPDACVLMCAASIDAMLKIEGLREGSLYSRIEKSLELQLIPKALHSWAHRVRLDANRPRHSDEKAPNVTSEEASRALEFAEAMAKYLFVLPALMPKSEGGEKDGADGGT